MQSNEVQTSRAQRAVNDLVLAEMFLVHATVESAIVIGEGITELRRQISSTGEDQGSAWESISSLLQRTADDALEPYTSRFRYLRRLRD